MAGRDAPEEIPRNSADNPIPFIRVDLGGAAFARAIEQQLIARNPADRGHPKVAQERSGHSAISTALDLRSHVIEAVQEDAAARLDAALGSAIKAGGEERPNAGAEAAVANPVALPVLSPKRRNKTTKNQ